MCGIVGYIGEKQARDILLNGLHKLEYRGYDSAGVSIADKKEVNTVKTKGKVAELANKLSREKLTGSTGIAHTRWATHGEPSETNSHPHTAGSITLVHNGIIENYLELKAELETGGYKFISQTDTEVVACLIDSFVSEGKDFEQSVTSALRRVAGTFGLAILCRDDPGKLIVARRGSPLILGVGAGEVLVASDATALVAHTDQVVYLEDDEVAVCNKDGYKVVDLENTELMRQSEKIDLDIEAIEKGGYEHFLIKEIMEQPSTVRNVTRGRINVKNGTVRLGGVVGQTKQLRNFKRLLVVACGTSYYAGLTGKYLLEKLIKVPVDVEFASEFRYRDPVINDETLTLFLSQSGETADTLACVKDIKRRGLPTLGVVNVVGSSIAREVDGGVYLHAGPEISVASTKAFTAQVVAQLLLGTYTGLLRNLSLRDANELVTAIDQLPKVIEQVLKQDKNIEKLAKKYSKFEHAMYLGRDALYPVALEGALKLKEISYIQAEAHPGGEMKHGPIALVDENLMIMYLNPKNDLYQKSRSNLEELRSRRGNIIAVATEGDKETADLASDVIYVPKVSSWIEPLVVNIPLQLFAYHMAVARGKDVDQPRNLAKSVTVE